MTKMPARQYIGARYIPVFADPVEWDNTRPYEYLTMVQHVGETYMSQQDVPIGADLPDTGQGEESNEFWVHMSNWNAQVETYRQEVLLYNGRISTLEDDLPIASFDSANTVKDAIDGLQNQIGAGFDSTDNITAVIGSGYSATSSIADAISALETANALKVTSYATVASMKAATGLYNGQIVHTNGFRTAGDGGAAFYAILDTGTANELDVIACGDLYAHYIYTGTCNFEQFGAYGDGTTDDHDAISKAFEYGNVKPLAKSYASTMFTLEVSNNFVQDFNGCTFVKIGEMENHLFQISPTADNLIIDVRNATFDCDRKAFYGLIIRHAADGADKNYKTIVNVDNVEIYETDNEDGATVYGSNGLVVYCGTINLNITNCHIHDIYRTADNAGIIGSRCIAINNVMGTVNVSNNVLENVYKGVNTLDCDALQIFENDTYPDEVNVLVENNTFKNSYTRFIKLQCRNVTVRKNKFINTWSSVDLRAPVDFQTAAGDFIDNVIEYSYAPNVTNDVDFIKMHFTDAGRVGVVNGNVNKSSATDIYRYFCNAYVSNNEEINIDLTVNDNNLMNCTKQFLRINLGATATPETLVNLKAKDNIVQLNSSNTFIVIDEQTFWKSNDSINKIFFVITGNKSFGTGRIPPISTGYTSAIGNIYLDNNVNIANTISSTNFDVSKIDFAKCYFNTNGSSGGMVNMPDGGSHRYTNVEIERYGNTNNLVILRSGSSGSEVSTNTAFVVART